MKKQNIKNKIFENIEKTSYLTIHLKRCIIYKLTKTKNKRRFKNGSVYTK